VTALAVWALERWPGRRALLVVDDLHVLAASEGEQLLGRPPPCPAPGSVLPHRAPGS
jgi:hypothetical protein